MSRVAVLLCSGAGVDVEGAALVDDLCDSPAAAADALRRRGASRVVLGVCRRPSADLLDALRRAGAEPFGVEAVRLAGAREPASLLGAAAAKLAALAPDVQGRPRLNAGGISRRSLFSRAALVEHVPAAVLDELRCTRCGLCVEVCPTAAIAPPRIDLSLCTGCGACVTSCPRHALDLAGSSTAQLEAQLEALLPSVDGVLLACARTGASARPGWALVELPTLRIVTPGWLLQLRARGVQAEVAPCATDCCAGAEGVAAFAARLPVRRTRTPLRLAEPQATVDAVARDAAAVRADASPLGLLAVDTARCTLCGACAVACPAGALRLDETGDAVELRHRPEACTGCGRCVAACPERAVRVERGVDPARLGVGELTPARAPRETCEACGAALAPAPLRRRLREVLGGPTENLCSSCSRIAVRRVERSSGWPTREGT